MIEYPIARKALLTELGVLAQPFGFRTVHTRQLYWRACPLGKCIFHLGFIPHGHDDMDMTMDISIRVEAIETLRAEHRATVRTHPWARLRPEEERWMATVGVDVGNFTVGRQKRWTVSEQSQIPDVAKSIMEDVRGVGFPFFERYSQPDALMAVLTRADPNYKNLSSLHADRCYNAVILAYLIKESDEAATIVEDCLGVLREREPDIIDEFSAFVTLLRVRHAKGQLPKLVE